MNLKLLNQIHQIHQDLAVCRGGDSVELLRLTEKRKVNLDLLKDIHELYYNGYLHLPKYCHVFGYSKADNIMVFFRKNNLKTLSNMEAQILYRDIILEKAKQTNLERYGFECSSKSPEIKDKMKQTNLERYGCENPSQSPEIKERIKQTNLRKYNQEYATQSPEIKERIKQTNLERYGSISPFGSPEIRKKMEQTNLRKYGSISPFGSPEIKEKIKQTNIRKIGVEYPMMSSKVRQKTKQSNLTKYGHEFSSQSPVVKDKMKRTNLERYGFECSSKSPVVKDKMKQTNLERYGYEYVCQNPETQEKIKATRKSNDWRCTKLLDLVENDPDKAPGFVMGNYSKSNHSKVLKRYGLYQENVSTPEAAIREILEKHNIEYLFQHRPKFMDGKELDFFIPNRRASNNPVSGNSAIAIEVNGLYWHSYPKKDKYYHQDKHLRCRSEGIQLLSFTEDQILDRLEIIESMILHKLGLTPYRLYAKKCDIRELSTKEAKDFLEKNHLHGFSNASTYLGLEYEGKLVHVMSFGNNRFKKSNHPELIRSASLRFHSVAGGFQRLLKYYKRSHGVDLVESYVDFNISNGQSYELASKSLGDLGVLGVLGDLGDLGDLRDLGNSSVRETVRETKRDNLTEPDLWFVYRGKRYRRQMFMKHNLYKIFSDFPRRGDQGYENITCGEFLRDRGVLEYYGAGNLKYLI